MQRYLASMSVLVMVISGCASQHAPTGEQQMPKTETGALATPSGGGTTSSTASEPAVANPAAEAAAPSSPRGPTSAASAPKRPASPTPNRKSRNTAAILGAVGGGLSNGAVGAYMESQKQDLMKTLHDEIHSGSARVDKLPHHVVRIRMPSRTAFDANSSSIKAGFCTTMDKIADVAIRYTKTTLTVVGNAESSASAANARKLSQRRALSIVQYLESKDVNPVRLAALTKGESNRVVSSGDADRQDNRRLEILVEPVLAK